MGNFRKFLDDKVKIEDDLKGFFSLFKNDFVFGYEIFVKFLSNFKDVAPKNEGSKRERGYAECVELS